MRGFLILVGVFCVWLAWYGDRVRQQRDAVEALRAYGATVYYDRGGAIAVEAWVPRFVRNYCGDDFFYTVADVRLCRDGVRWDRAGTKDLSPAPLERLEDLPHVTHLVLCGTQANDSNLRHLARLKNLQHLEIWWAVDVSDDGVAYLRELRELRDILITESQMTDKALETFSKLSKLHTLKIQGGFYSDAGAKHLTRLRALRYVSLAGRYDRINPITDQSLDLLFDLPNLVRVDSRYTEVSNEYYVNRNWRPKGKPSGG